MEEYTVNDYTQGLIRKAKRNRDRVFAVAISLLIVGITLGIAVPQLLDGIFALPLSLGALFFGLYLGLDWAQGYLKLVSDGLLYHAEKAKKESK